MDSVDVIPNFGIYIILIGAIMGLFLILLLMMIFPCSRNWFKQKLINLYQKIVWNGIINLITVGYLKYSISWWICLRVIIIGYNDPSIVDYVIAVLLGKLVILYPVTCLYVLIHKPN